MRIIFVLVIIIFLCSCNTSTAPAEDENSDPLIPLSTGNYWLYKHYSLDPDTGEIQGDAGLRKYGFYILKPQLNTNCSIDTSIYQMSICDGELKLNDDSNWLPYGGNKLVYQNDKGFYNAGIVRQDSIATTFNDVIFSSPSVKGKSVFGHVFYYSTVGNYLNIPSEQTAKYTCVSTDSLFITPVGSFNCVVYKQEYYEDNIYIFEVYYFIKRGIGIVGMVQEQYYKYGKIQRYLRKYVLDSYKI